MPKEVEIRVRPEDLYAEPLHRTAVARMLGVDVARVRHLQLQRRAIDARRSRPRFVLRYQAWVDEEPTPLSQYQPRFQNVATARPVIVVGSGPAGLFAALRLIELGFRPIVLERGKAVRARRRDIAAVSKRGVVVPDSNYCFGEGGAGTFSDGKLYTRSTKRGAIRPILDMLVLHGASSDILVDAHPHIGTNKLPALVSRLSDTIRDCGGDVLFDCRVERLLKDASGVRGVVTPTHGSIEADVVILATGHSARDVFEMVAACGGRLEAKPFALGVRVEHPQSVIDAMQYHSTVRHANLPPAAYSIRTQVRERGVFSFCMCPGGIICPAATSPNEVVVNGWSPSKRNSRFANSGIVVEVTSEDLRGFGSDPVWAGIAMQQVYERRSYELGGGSLRAPAQRLVDLLENRCSVELPETSYHPGVTPTALSEVFQEPLYQRLQEGFRDFGRRMPEYLDERAVVVAVESRTSSPIRIPRDSLNLFHPDLPNLIPCGEGAGYAGGIMSAALDGQRAAEAAARALSAV